MARGEDMPELPDLEQFRQRIEAAAQATEEFTAAVGQAAPQQGTPQATQQQQQESPAMRDILNALHLIHDEAVQIRTILERLTQ